MIAYASRTGTRRNLAALRRHGWRLIVSAAGRHSNEGFPYAIDSGAWSGFEDDQFRRCLDKLGQGADWIALPDIVCGGDCSLDLSLSWIDTVAGYGAPLLLVVQDGMRADVIRLVLADARLAGLFVGGSTDFKLQTLPLWAALTRSVGKYLHVGRVNSQRRIWLCEAVGADSFDGSSASRYAVTTDGLALAMRQTDLRI
jgi:hypothetical protein